MFQIQQGQPNGLKIVILPSGQEAPIANHTDTVLVPPKTNQLEDFQASCLTSTDEELAQADKIIETFEVESGPSLSIEGNLKTNIEFWKFIGAPNKKGV